MFYDHLDHLVARALNSKIILNGRELMDCLACILGYLRTTEQSVLLSTGNLIYFRATQRDVSSDLLYSVFERVQGLVEIEALAQSSLDAAFLDGSRDRFYFFAHGIFRTHNGFEVGLR